MTVAGTLILALTAFTAIGLVVLAEALDRLHPARRPRCPDPPGHPFGRGDRAGCPVAGCGGDVRRCLDSKPPHLP